MAGWGVFHRRPEHRTVLDHVGQPAPRFRVPLSRAVLDDPAFSPDPRAHPHFPLPHAGSYKAFPVEPLLVSPSVSSDSASLSLSPSPSPSPSPTVSPATSPSQSPKSPVSPLRLSPPGARPGKRSTPPASQNTTTPHRGRMRALVRRLTTRHGLDRIDELDETDPFGGSYHHDGPYEAIASNAAQPSLPHTESDTAPRRGNCRHSAPEFDPRSLRLGQRKLSSRVPAVHGEAGLSLHLEPGQILQQNTINTSHTSGTALSPSQPSLHPSTVVGLTRPGHSRSQSLPGPWTRSLGDSTSLDPPNDSQKRLSSLGVPREHQLHHPGGNTPNMPISLSPHHDPDAAPYVPHQSETPVFPPPRYESRLHSSGPPSRLQHVPSPPPNTTSRGTYSAETIVSSHDPRHKSARSPDGSYTMNGIIIQPSSSIQNRPLGPPRIHHLPKRLVTPAPLQPQPPQLQYKFPSPASAAWQDDDLDYYDLVGAYFEGQPAMYIQEPKLLRKRTTFPAKMPIPDHVPMSQDDALPTMGKTPVKAATEIEETKARTRRRRLSKRKNDI